MVRAGLKISCVVATRRAHYAYAIYLQTVGTAYHGANTTAGDQDKVHLFVTARVARIGRHFVRAWGKVASRGMNRRLASAGSDLRYVD